MNFLQFISNFHLKEYLYTMSSTFCRYKSVKAITDKSSVNVVLTLMSCLPIESEIKKEETKLIWAVLYTG